MTYIIENAMIYKENQFVKTSLLVDEEKILSVQPSFPKYRYMKMNTQNFLLTPSYVFFLDSPPEKTDKSFFLNNFLLRGCTTVIASTRPVEYLQELQEAKEEVRNCFFGSPLDFVVITKIPVKSLTIPFIQRAKREKLPAIIVQFQNLKELYKIPWGWIREAMFPYNSPLVPEFIGNPEDERKMLEGWTKILSREKIPHLTSPLPQFDPLKTDCLKQIGVYPIKGYLHPGGELSYNLFLQEKTSSTATEISRSELKQPVVTVHKGKIIRVQNRVFYNVVPGEELIINRPSFFK